MTAGAAVRPVAPDLYLIVLDPPALPGFRDFIGAWCCPGPPALLVDVGPAATVPALVRALDHLGVGRLDAVLLTHIHIDHAGGLGDLLTCFPGTPVVCHRKAHRHLADPEKLWQGSLATLGDTARAYGPIRPVPEGCLVDAEGYDAFGVQTLATPGHAVHHVSFAYRGKLFAGEAGGVYAAIGDAVYLRPATPPRFYLETNLASLDRLRAVDHEILCYGHFGAVRDGRRRLAAHRRQLLEWAEIIAAVTAGLPAEVDPVEACLARLLEADPLLAAFHVLPEDVCGRERGFLRNSIRGFIGYLKDE